MALHKFLETSFSPTKNQSNKARHGLDFADFHGWDEEALTFEDDRFDYGETRWVDIGRIDGQAYMLVYTVLEGETGGHPELWRLISWRRLSEKEALRYDRFRA
jgi:uncharacterized DUF497 family protein